jgi:hypothetical protein
MGICGKIGKLALPTPVQDTPTGSHTGDHANAAGKRHRATNPQSYPAQRVVMSAEDPVCQGTSSWFTLSLEGGGS